MVQGLGTNVEKMGFLISFPYFNIYFLCNMCKHII